MCFGASGAAAQTGVYPLEMATASNSSGMKKGGRHVQEYVPANHGCKTAHGKLYAGLLSNYAKILPSAAISLYVYELMKQMFDIDK